MTSAPTRPVPFAPGSISLRLYPHSELDAPGILRELGHQARLALEHGFDGIMLSEHHGGFGGYLPNPLQVSAFLLDETDAGWVAPCPVILPLRPVAQFAEEVAWLGVRHPGRVGLGVAAGALPLDFEVMEIRLADAVPLFKERLPRIVAMLNGRGLGELRGDQALETCARSPIPVLSAAVSVAAARRAARSGAGILTDGMSPLRAVRKLCDTYGAEGGTKPRVLVRRVWLGRERSDLIEAQRAVYDAYAPGAGVADATVIAEDPAELADRLLDCWSASGTDALNLRVHLPGVPPADARLQIEALGAGVLPRLRQSSGRPADR